jgi:hypothetical protein
MPLPERPVDFYKIFVPAFRMFDFQNGDGTCFTFLKILGRRKTETINAKISAVGN